MALSTQDIIKILPFEEEFKTNLLTNWEKLSEDQRFTIEQMVWIAYGEVYRTVFEMNKDIAIAEVAEGNLKLDKDLHLKVREKTERDLRDRLTEVGSTVDLSTTRKALQDILNKSSQSN